MGVAKSRGGGAMEAVGVGGVIDEGGFGFVGAPGLGADSAECYADEGELVAGEFGDDGGGGEGELVEARSRSLR